MKTKYEQIVDVNKIASLDSIENIGKIIIQGKSEKLPSASTDTKRTLLLVIDVQNDFMEDIGSLAVQGSKGDVERLTKWIYTNISKLSQVICSLDSHSLTQIFHANWWIDKEGNQPQAFTIITHQDVVEGRWIVVNGEKERSLDYLENLETSGLKQLCIWPYHCLSGTRGAELESEFSKMLYFHSAARNSTPIFIQKGQNPFTEMYGIVKAEYDPTNYINSALLSSIEKYDEIYIAGEASSHCVLASLEQIIEHFEDRRDICRRITLLEDCMSPIVGFEETTQARFAELIKEYEIKLKKSTEVFL